MKVGNFAEAKARGPNERQEDQILTSSEGKRLRSVKESRAWVRLDGESGEEEEERRVWVRAKLLHHVPYSDSLVENHTAGRPKRQRDPVIKEWAWKRRSKHSTLAHPIWDSVADGFGAPPSVLCAAPACVSSPYEHALDTRVYVCMQPRRRRRQQGGPRAALQPYQPSYFAKSISALKPWMFARCLWHAPRLRRCNGAS
jgi:hypothetical protein